MGMALKDIQLKNTRVLPGAASTTVDGAAIDLGHGSFGDVVAPFEVKLTAPALTTSMAPDTRTMTYSIISSSSSDLSGPVVTHASCIVQTGAGGVGAATTSVTVRLPVDVLRYIGARVVS